MSDVAFWLEGLGLGLYATVFAEHAIDMSVLPDLTELDFEKIGVLRSGIGSGCSERSLLVWAEAQCPRLVRRRSSGHCRTPRSKDGN